MIYTYIKSSLCAPKTYRMSDVSYISITLEKRNALPKTYHVMSSEVGPSYLYFHRTSRRFWAGQPLLKTPGTSMDTKAGAWHWQGTGHWGVEEWSGRIQKISVSWREVQKRLRVARRLERPGHLDKKGAGDQRGLVSREQGAALPKTGLP